MNSRGEVVRFLLQEVSAISGAPVGKLSEATPLIGGETVLNSRGLVELLVALEEFSEEKLHVHFDWTSDSAMRCPENSSASRGRKYACDLRSTSS